MHVAMPDGHATGECPSVLWLWICMCRTSPDLWGIVWCMLAHQPILFWVALFHAYVRQHHMINITRKISQGQIVKYISLKDVTYIHKKYACDYSNTYNKILVTRVRVNKLCFYFVVLNIKLLFLLRLNLRNSKLLHIYKHVT